METSNIPILLADSHTCSRIGLNQVLTEVGFMVVADVESADDLWQQLDEYPLPVICKKAIQAIENGKTVFLAEKKQTFSHRK